MQTVLAIFISITTLFTPNDQEKQEITDLQKESKRCFAIDLDSSVLFANQALIKAEQAGYILGQARSQFLLGAIADAQNKPSQSVTSFLKALNLYAGIDDEKSLSNQAKICTTLGKIYREHYKIVEAIEYYDKGLEFALEAVDQKSIVKLLHNKAIAYRKMGQLTKANELLWQKLEMVEADDHKERQYTYNQLGLVHHELKVFDQARAYYQQMIDLETDPEPSRFRGQAYHNMANTYQEQKDYVQAWQYYEKALKEKEPLNRAKDLFITYQDMANLALLQDRRVLALSYAEKATPLLDKLPKTPEYYDQYLLLSRCYRTSDPDQSFINTDFFATENTTFIELQKELIAQGMAYKMDLITSTYLNAIKEQKQQIRFYWTLFGGLVFLLLTGFASFRLWQIYRYESPEVALSMIKNPKELIYLFDLSRKEKAEMRKTIKQYQQR